MPREVRWGHPDQWAGGRDEQERHRQELAAVRGELAEARAQAERAIETRENANAVSIRVEGENQRLRAQAENLAQALDELLIGGADAVSMEHAKRAAKVVLRSYRKARDAT